MRCLWLARSMPVPETAGDRIYTGRLAHALAAAGASVTFLGFAPDGLPAPAPGIAWRVVPGGPRAALPSLFSTMPLVARRHATPAYRAAVREAAADGAWDAVVIDQYGMGWVLAQRAVFAGTPRFVFVTHDHEETVTRLQAEDRSVPALKRLFLWQNHLKARAIERRTARGCDLLTTITEADAALFAGTAPGIPAVALTPGYAGPRLAARRIGPDTPRAALIFGSFRWSAKQANLRAFLEQADPVARKAGLEIRVVGDAPEPFMAEIQGRFRSVRMTGFVEDPTPHLDARLAVLAEPIGGGFKMKLLDYVFRRIPVAALEVCAEGLPAPVRRAMILRPGLDALLPAMLEAIDDLPRLNAMQEEAFAAAQGRYDWADRGRTLLAALRTPRRAGAAPRPQPVA